MYRDEKASKIIGKQTDSVQIFLTLFKEKARNGTLLPKDDHSSQQNAFILKKNPIIFTLNAFQGGHGGEYLLGCLF